MQTISAQPTGDKIIHICAHCGTDCGTQKYCGQCFTAKGRQEQDEENRSILKEPFHENCK